MADTENKLENSILKELRAVIVGEEDDTSFDTDLIIHINSMFNFLQQCGVGPKTAFAISGEDEKWSDFVSEDRFNMVKSYMVLKIRLLFDPPSSSYVLSAWNESIAEMEWRLKEEAEEGIFN